MNFFNSFVDKGLLDRLNPVSYTHLDVYKRQAGNHTGQDHGDQAVNAALQCGGNPNAENIFIIAGSRSA